MTARTKRIIPLLIVVFILATTAPTFAGQIIYVDDDGPADFNNIQTAVNDSNDGDIIEVAPETYERQFTQSIDFINKDIIIRPKDPEAIYILSSVKVDLSNSSSRLKMVTHLGKRASEAKNAAWTRAQRKGWRVRGEMDGIIFELMAIEDSQPIYNITNNINAAISTATDLIRNTAPYNLDGRGFLIGIWDAGSVLSTHQEFGTRVSVIDGADSHWHSTHVGGIIGAAGVDSAALGMAPGVDIDSYDWDLASSEMTDRAASYPEEPNKIYLSNHSYSIATGWTTGDYSGNYGFHWFGVWGDREADGFGQYSSETVTWDSICYSAPYYLPFKSAGNDRGDYVPSEGETFYYYDGGGWQSKSYNSSTDPYADNWDNGGFDTIPHRGNSKNIMTVGAVSDAVYMGERSLSMAMMLSFSGWGPTDDGRIKPDIVTNGESLYSSTNDSDTSYDTHSGTSMSAPSGAGSATLLIEYYCELFPGQAMRASTLKGLIIHTADDLGNPGPDYSHGWGLMNSKAAADQIKDRKNYSGTNKIVEGTLNTTNPNDLYTFIWNGDTAIRATICWTDPPADALEELDNSSPRLVNDLDLHIIDPDGITMYYPFVLDPANPDDPATTGDNTLDNVEQVLIPAPSAGGIYTVEVSYKETLTNNEQHYSLIISGQHHLPGPTGIIILDKDTYSCDDLLEIELRDGDLVGNGTQAILVSTDGADSETVTLYEDSYRSGVFTGTIDTESEAVDPEDGILQVGHGQTITATYYDTNDGTGSPAEANDTATVDCQGPVVVNVQVLDVTSSGAKITFETNEPSSACIRYGLSCEDPSTIIDDPIFATSHRFQLSGLVPETGYYFELAAWDAVGNETVDDNNRVCYQFTTIAVSTGIHVPGDYPTIQEAINAVNTNDVDFVIVADGIYTGNGNRDIDFNGKAITVKSENGPGNCIIDCQGSSSSPHRGFRFHNREGTDSIVSGFTIKNGFGPEEELPVEMESVYLPAGGAIFCESSSPTINNCIFSNNKVLNPDYHNFSRGGAIACKSGSPTISSSTFADNEAGCDGGAIYGYGGALTIANCNFNSNISHRHGGAIECEGGHPRIENCTISNNRSSGYGGGIFCDDSAATIINCVVNNNTAYDPGPGGAFGGGMELQCNIGQVIEVINCTIVGNWAENSGGGLRTSCCGNYEVVNSIVWNNFPSQISAYQTVVTYCNIQGGFSGEGNIDAEPNFVSVSDYHLTEGSACIDAGTNGALCGFPPRDLDGTPRPLDGDGDQIDIVDMGAFEYWDKPAAPFVALEQYEFWFFAFSDTQIPEDQVLSIRNGWIGELFWQITEDCPWLEVTPTDGNSLGEIDQVTLSIDTTGLSQGNYVCEITITDPNAASNPQVIPVHLRVGARFVPEEYSTIQAAIDDSYKANVILVADGTYTGTGNKNIDFKGKAITVMSENGHEHCIIDCENSGRAFNFHNGELNNSILNGFTICNGRVTETQTGGGISCYKSSPTIKNCRISNCHSDMVGGGIYFRDSTGKVVNSIITGCTGNNNGGAVHSDDGYPEILNCTITGNSAGLGSGYYCRHGDGAVKNSIFWDNSGIEIDSAYSNRLPTVSYSDVQGGFSGVGNINLDPCFVYSAGGDYHLSINSPCVDTGNPSSDAGESDIDGDSRVINGRIDMGADEFDHESPIVGLSPLRFEFYSFSGGSNPESQILSVYNQGMGTLNWQISESCSWLDVTPTIGSSTGEPNEVVLSVDISGLDVEIYSCELAIICDEAINSPRTIQVYLYLSDTIYVPSDFVTIQEAINAASNGMIVSVAPGTYTGAGNRDLDFEGKAITVQSTEPYDPTTVAATVIDCQGSGSDYHRGFYFRNGEGSDSIVLGLTIINGYIGGGEGRGGGIYCARNSNPTIKYCTFRDNYAYKGGGIYLHYPNSKISHCTFTGNSAGFLGGGFGCENSGNAIIEHCTFSDNEGDPGGGIVVFYSTAQISHCILWDNIGAELHLENGATATVSFSNVQGGEAGVSQHYSNTLNWGVGNINLDPSFVDAMNYDYHLLWDSPCIDAGDPNYASEPDETDIDGEPRIMGGRIDMGFDEVGEKRADLSRNGLINIEDVVIFVKAWLSNAGEDNWYILCDLYQDGQIDFADWAELAQNWLWQADWYEP